MILKRGVTAFTGGYGSFERDWEACRAEFLKNCYSYVQQINGRVLAWDEPDIHIQYAHVEIDEETFYIFHNHMYDYLALAIISTSDRSVNGLTFIDYPLLKVLFEKRYAVLTVKQLEEPLVRQAKSY